MVEICGVEELSVKLSQKKMRWFGHLKRGEGDVLGKVGEVESWGATAGEKA